MKLEEKTAIVTGVSGGIGLAVVKALLDKNVKVSGWGRNDPGIKNEHFNFNKCDITKPREVATAFKGSLEFFDGRVDILINNAGYGAFKNMEDFPEEEWRNMFDVNVHGLFYATKYVLPLMREQHSGHIINISSIAGTTGVNQGTAYCGTKWAVRGISQALYKEVKKDNIKVTCLFPGSVNTRFFDDVEGTNANDTMLHPEDVAETMIHLLETPDNFNPSELEIRPMNVKYQ